MPECPSKNASQSFQATQRAFAAHIRHPDKNPVPGHLEDRRMAIYRSLFHNNIESFLATGFPVLKSLMPSQNWHQMVRDFIYRHHSHSPYFLKISEEFLQYLQQEREFNSSDPVFIIELAHYEWIELALDVSPLDIPSDLREEGNMLDDRPAVSPTAWRLTYQYPVHQIGPDFQPTEPGETVTALIVYRDRNLQIGFMESNLTSLRLLEIFETEQLSGRGAIVKLAEEIGYPQPDQLMEFGVELLNQFSRRDIICGFHKI
jgi:hypothetical protein